MRVSLIGGAKSAPFFYMSLVSWDHRWRSINADKSCINTDVLRRPAVSLARLGRIGISPADDIGIGVVQIIVIARRNRSGAVEILSQHVAIGGKRPDAARFID